MPALLLQSLATCSTANILPNIKSSLFKTKLKLVLMVNHSLGFTVGILKTDWWCHYDSSHLDIKSVVFCHLKPHYCCLVFQLVLNMWKVQRCYRGCKQRAKHTVYNTHEFLSITTWNWAKCGGGGPQYVSGLFVQNESWIAFRLIIQQLLKNSTHCRCFISENTCVHKLGPNWLWQ